MQGIFHDTFNCDEHASETLALLTTYGNFLPQGAPTSPALANAAALKLDDELIRICEESKMSYKYDYTRYVDDITISGGTDLAVLLPEFYRAIERHGFRANAKKLKVARPCVRQKVTGVVVNTKINPPKKLIRKLRQQLYFCKRFGVQGHCERMKIIPTNFLRQTKGMIGYVRMTNPEVADQFMVQLYTALTHTTGTPSATEQAKLLLLKSIIKQELTATFAYFDEHYRVVPAQVKANKEGVKVLRAFVLSPTQGWRRFLVSDIQFLQMEKNRS